MHRHLLALFAALLIGWPTATLALDAGGRTSEAPSAGQAANAQTADAASEDPRIAHYASETGKASFILDRSGEQALLKFEGSPEILVLEMVPGPQGVTYLKNSFGATIVRLMPWGGATVYGPDGSEGGAFGAVEKARPLEQASRRREEVDNRVREIKAKLNSEYGMQIAIRLQTRRVTLDTKEPIAEKVVGSAMPEEREHVAVATTTSARSLVEGDQQDRQSMMAPKLALQPDKINRTGTLSDALELTAIALERLAKDDLAREIMAERIERIVLTPGAAPGVALVETDLIVTYTPEMGLYGRPSSARIERFLLDNL